MAQTRTLLTAEDLWHLPPDGRQYELVKGELVEVVPPGGEHGYTAVVLAARLLAWVKPRDLGWVLVETGFVLARGPDIVRGPDVAFVVADRLPQGLPRGFIEGAPDLAVEIVSPSRGAACRAHTAPDVQKKVLEYLAAGARLVWVLDPQRRTVTIHSPGATPQVLRPDDSLTGGDVLPGLATPVRELFP